MPENKNTEKKNEYVSLNYDGQVPDLGEWLQTDKHFYRHHLVYQNKYNKLIQEHDDLKFLSPNKVIEKIWIELKAGSKKRLAIFQNAMQAFNHTLLWKSMQRSCDPLSPEMLSEEDFVETGRSRFGSGWLWIVAINGEIHLCTTANEESVKYSREELVSNRGKKVPRDAKILAVIDLWEHAHYGDYSSRVEYLKIVFDELLNTAIISEKLATNGCILADLELQYEKDARDLLEESKAE